MDKLINFKKLKLSFKKLLSLNYCDSLHNLQHFVVQNATKQPKLQLIKNENLQQKLQIFQVNEKRYVKKFKQKSILKTHVREHVRDEKLSNLYNDANAKITLKCKKKIFIVK